MNPKFKKYYIFFAVLAVVSALAIFSNTALRRGPVHDAKVVSDLREIQTSIDHYYLGSNQLPGSIGQLDLDADIQARAKDYEYAKLGPTTFQLCANFMKLHRTNTRYPSDAPDPDDHGQGRQCFTYVETPIGNNVPFSR